MGYLFLDIPFRPPLAEQSAWSYGITFFSKNWANMRVTSKGQVTIPIEIRDQFGIQPNTEVRFVVRHGLVVLEKDTGRGSMNRPARGEVMVNRLRKIARQSTKATMTTDELMALTRGE